MPVSKQEAHKALELLEDYRKKLPPENLELREALARAIIAIRSRLFQALLDINEFYTYTLEDSSKPAEVKAVATHQLAEKWENISPPIPAGTVEIAKKILDDETLDSTDLGEKAKVGGNAYVDEGDWHTENVDLKKTSKGGLGISIAGGTDNPHANDGNPGIFITKLIQGTPAEMDGRLQLGDQIASVNAVSLLDVTHADAVKILKEADHDIVLVIRRKNDREWSPASDHGTMDRRYKLHVERAASPLSRDTSSPSRYADITLKRNQKGLGFSIAGGIGNEHVKDDDGIFVTKIISGGAAEEEGTLSVGDRILQVNGESMVSITHDEAVSILKAVQDTALLKIEKNAIGMSSPFNTTDDDEGEEEEEEDREEESPKRTVVLNRPEETGLGFNIIGGEGDTGIFISYISPGSVADKSGALKAGDQILKVNGQRMTDCSHEEAALALKGAGSTVTLIVQYQPDEFTDFQQRLQQLQELQATSVEPSTSPGIKPPPVKQLYVRALFDYDSTTDDDCPTHGLSFKHGDILHVLNGSDGEWWQAALVGNHADDGPQGLIPSSKRIERRTKTNQKSVKFIRGEMSFTEKDRKLSVNEKRGARASFKLSRKLPFIKKISSSGEPDEPKDAEGDHIPTYEPVALEPRGYARPVIILGPLKEDMNDLLVQEFPDKFAGCVPHTTREPREGEVDGRDYHFVSSVEQMERDIQAHLFIEAGRYKENLYGTSIKAVQEVANQGKHCILGVSGYAIRRLQMADLHPIAICIRPSSVSVIQAAQPKNSEELCRQIYDKGRRIEQEFAEYFTAIVEGDSQSDLYSKVKNVIHEQSGNYIWVPSNEAL